MNPPSMISNYQIFADQILGQGAHNTVVYQGKDTRNNQNVAIKVIPKAEAMKNQVTRYLFESEKQAVKEIQNPYVVNTYDVIQTQDQCFIVMEQLLGGTLKEKIANLKQTGCFPQSRAQILSTFSKILNGYTAINQKLFIHRDIKTQNIMMKTFHGDPVFIDFGYCQPIMGKRPGIQYNVGSPSYMAPQAYLKNLYSQKSDVWSLGIVLYEMLNGSTPDRGQYSIQYFKNIDRVGKLQYSLHPSTDPVFVQLLAAALEVRQHKRATAHKLKYIVDKAMIAQLNKNIRNKRVEESKKVNFMGNSVTPNSPSDLNNERSQSSQFGLSVQPIQFNTNYNSPTHNQTIVNNIAPQNQQFSQNNIVQNQRVSFSRIPQTQQSLSPRIIQSPTYDHGQQNFRSMPMIPQVNMQRPQQHFQFPIQNNHTSLQHNIHYVDHPKSQVVLRPSLINPEYVVSPNHHMESTITHFRSPQKIQVNNINEPFRNMNNSCYISAQMPMRQFINRDQRIY